MKPFWDMVAEDSDYAKNEKIDWVDGRKITLASQREFHITNIEGGYTIDKNNGDVKIKSEDREFNMSFKDFLSKNWPQ